MRRMRYGSMIASALMPTRPITGIDMRGMFTRPAPACRR
jgi:hypothetical protein